MKNSCFMGRLRVMLLAPLLLLATTAAWSHGMGGSGGFHSSGSSHSFGSHNFGFHHDGDHFFHHHDGDHFFHHRDRFFFGFGYPFYGYPYYYYPYDYEYYGYSGAAYSDQYWTDLTAAVQTELARDGYYHGAIDGVVSSDTLRAIRTYRKAKGLPVNSQIDRRLLRSLDI